MNCLLPSRFLIKSTTILLTILSPFHLITPVATITTLPIKKGRMLLVSSPNSVADVYAVPMFSDNYGYFLVDRQTGHALTVDPGDGEVIYQAAKDHSLNLQTVLCTHKHEDHVGGNKHLQNVLPSLQFIATSYEPIPCATQLVKEGDVIPWGSLQIRVLSTFCHTAGHVVYVIDQPPPAGSDVNENYEKKDPILFSGDTLFVGGCGRFFEGTAQQMLTNMDKLSGLPGNTQVFCAHEYTEGNFKFLNAIDPETVAEKYQQIRQRRAEGKPTIPSTIAEELKYNLFMHCRDERIQRILNVNNPVDAMQELRNRKNNFK